MAMLREVYAFRTQNINQLRETYELAVESSDNSTFASLFARRYQHLETIRGIFQTHHDNIITLIAAQTQTNFTAEDVVRKDFDECYYKIQDVYHQLFPPNPTIVQTSNTSTSNRPSSPQIRLPKISLRSFNGNIANWTLFFDLFNTLIDNNNSLSANEKLQYLLTSLHNEPLSIVENLPLAADNYEIAYRTLKDRYEYKRLLASSYWNAIESSSKLNSDAPTGLLHLLKVFTENLAALDQLNIDKWDFLLFNCFLQKLGVNTRKRFETEFAQKEIPKYIELKDFVDRHCGALEANAMLSKKQDTNENAHKGKGDPFHEPTSKLSLSIPTLLYRRHYLVSSANGPIR